MTKTNNVRHIGANRNVTKKAKQVANAVKAAREIDHVDTLESVVTMKCARSKEAVARMMGRMSPADKAVLEMATKVHGVKAQVERELLTHGNVVVQVLTNVVHYADGHTAKKDPYVKYSRVEALAA